MGVTSYGQMTAGGWMYIGPQGSFTVPSNTLLNAGRLKLGVPDGGDLTIKSSFHLVSVGWWRSGKAAEIAKAVAIVAEVDRSRIPKPVTLKVDYGKYSRRSAEEAVKLAQAAPGILVNQLLLLHGNIT